MSYGKITRVDAEKREIEGTITFEQVIPGVIFGYEASKKAFSYWHEHSNSVLEAYDMTHPAGKCTGITFNDETKQAIIRIYVSKGAEGTLEKAINGDLTGVGLTYRPLIIETIIRNRQEYDHLIQYDLLSLSLVALSPEEVEHASIPAS